MFPKSQIYHKIDTKTKMLKKKRDRVRELIISDPIDNINKTDLTVEGVLKDIMSKNGPHLWEKQLLEIVNQYDDKNNRERICAYRKVIVMLQDRLHKRDDPHMIRVIIKKILRSYKKRLEVALDTLTSTPPSSDDEDLRSPMSVKNPPSVHLSLASHSREVSVIVAKSCDFNYIKHNENHIYEKNSKIKKHKNHQKIEKDSSFGINKSQKKVKSKNKTIEKRNIEKTIKVNQNSHTQKPKKKILK